ncbi:uncharacterized protein Triagg1_5172 [Trichoderma aggressivum f. europaeum]|uniref:Peptidase S8/S53 domain-containing protein n=1 Tax=Trichoderma aggressivum f. europaeum TaxID=173218 RepID=A0AAE1IEV4_9HYPO|nr:hypothetical protein Triagg1_5172 [Trichoderma aggressivum f. europaeum]
MRPTDLEEEWQMLEGIRSNLYGAIQRVVKEADPTYDLLCSELDSLLVSVPTDRDVDRETIQDFKAEIKKLYNIVDPIVRRTSLNSPAFLDVQTDREQPEAGPTTLGQLSLSDAKAILSRLISFKDHLQSIFCACLHETATAAHYPEPCSTAFFEMKRKLIGSLFENTIWRMNDCEKSADHHLLLQGDGLNWNTESGWSISLLLSFCQDSTEWHEIKCLLNEYVDPIFASTLSLNSNLIKTRNLPRSKHKKMTRRPLRSLCEGITDAQQFDEVLDLFPHQGRLYKQPLEQTRAQSRAVAEVKTLDKLIKEDRLSPSMEPDTLDGIFTLPQKRQLSLNLSWCFLYLFDCSWIRNGWSADNISLISSMNAPSSIPEFNAPPYISCGLHCISSENDSSSLGSVEGDSVFLALGKLLVEIHLGRRISTTVSSEIEPYSLWLTLNKILKGPSLSYATSYYALAIQGCLDLYRSSRDMEPEEKILELPDLIYAQIIIHLEEDFKQYSKRLKEYTNSRWSSIQPEKSGTVAGRGPKKTLNSPQIASENSITTSRWATRSNWLAGSITTPSFPSESAGLIPIINDLEHDMVASEPSVSSSKYFLNKMQTFLASNLPTNCATKHVKICIIDTGIDMKHPSLRGAKKRIEKMWDFKGDTMDLKDDTGHGTNVAELILRLAPEAAICVAKVAVAKTMAQGDTKLISEAIHWALQQDVDIISLSLALDSLDPAIDWAIKKAIAADKIIVAAAGDNSGNNQLRAYPGNNRNVLCIHASNGKGKDGGLSPRALSNDDNFMTLGMHIPLIWKGETVIRSGTSLATAVAAAIAADILAIVPEVVHLTVDQLKRLRSSDGMRLMFRLLSMNADNGYSYFAPWILWDGTNSEDYIREQILNALKR